MNAKSGGASGKFLVEGVYDRIDFDLVEPLNEKRTPRAQRLFALRKSHGSGTTVMGTDGLPGALNVPMTAEQGNALESTLKGALEQLLTGHSI